MKKALMVVILLILVIPYSVISEDAEALRAQIDMLQQQLDALEAASPSQISASPRDMGTIAIDLSTPEHTTLGKGDVKETAVYSFEVTRIGKFDQDSKSGYASEKEYEYLLVSAILTNLSSENMNLGDVIQSEIVFRKQSYYPDVWGNTILEPLVSREMVFVYRVPNMVLDDDYISECKLSFRILGDEIDIGMDLEYVVSGVPESVFIWATVKGGTNLNLRERASSTGGIIKRMHGGERVRVIEKGEEWCKIEYDGETGYSMTKYLIFE